MSGELPTTPISGLRFAGGRFTKPGFYIVTRRKSYRVLALRSTWFKFQGRFW